MRGHGGAVVPSRAVFVGEVNHVWDTLSSVHSRRIAGCGEALVWEGLLSLPRWLSCLGLVSWCSGFGGRTSSGGEHPRRRRECVVGVCFSPPSPHLVSQVVWGDRFWVPIYHCLFPLAIDRAGYVVRGVVSRATQGALTPVLPLAKGCAVILTAFSTDVVQFGAVLDNVTIFLTFIADSW